MTLSGRPGFVVPDESRYEDDAAAGHGCVQPHGALLVLSADCNSVVQASTNLAGVLGLDRPVQVGQAASELLTADALERIRGLLAQRPAQRPAQDPDSCPGEAQGAETYPLPVAEGRSGLVFSLHRAGAFVMVEIERSGAANPFGCDFSRIETHFSDELATAHTWFEVARRTAEAVAEVARYDRVMIYRFLPDGSGEVIAEVRQPAANAYLGLRFPAGDIPPGTRRHYECNGLRVITDVAAPPVPLLATQGGGDSGAALDLRRAVLRAVSPAHAEYLRNLKVGALLVASVLVDGRLWGLIVCHHNRPRNGEPGIRAQVARLATLATGAITRLEAAQQAAAERRVMGHLAAIARMSPTAGNVVQWLIGGDPGLLDLANADGLAVAAGNRVACFGQTPEPALILRLAEIVRARDEGALATACLSDIDPAAAECRSVAAGMLAITLPTDPAVLLAAFRREQVHEVWWSGRPDHGGATLGPALGPAFGSASGPAPVDPMGAVLPGAGPQAPRRTFERWQETVSGHCQPWEAEAVAAWQALPAWLGAAFGDYEAAAQRLAGDIGALEVPAQIDSPLLRTLVNAMSGVLLVVSTPQVARPRVIAANREFRRLFDLIADELVGRDLAEAMDRVGIDAGPALAIPIGGSYEAPAVRDGASERVLAISRRPLLRVATVAEMGPADVTLSAWQFDDITTTRRTEHALHSAREQALVASRAKSEFLANMSHELRTPLNTIIGFSEIMRAELFGSLGNPRYKEYVTHIETAGENLLKVIGDILDLSKAEAGKYVLEEQVIDIAGAIEEVCTGEHIQAERAGLKLMQDLAPEPLFMQGDERALKQILLNLLSNSFKFTPTGGMVTCRSVALPVGAIAIEVQDTGVGIPEEYLHRVLDPVATSVAAGRTSLSRQAAGSGGLGLAVVRVLADLHDAHVTVRSQAGRGTSIRIAFPAWRTIAGAEASAARLQKAVPPWPEPEKRGSRGRSGFGSGGIGGRKPPEYPRSPPHSGPPPQGPPSPPLETLTSEPDV